MTVEPLRNNLAPTNGHLLAFRFSRFPQVKRHRWEGTERIPNEQTVRSLAQDRDGKVFFVPVKAFPADLSTRLRLAEVYQDFSKFCKVVGFCSHLSFGEEMEDRILVRSATFSDSVIYGDYQAQELSPGIVRAFLGEEFFDARGPMLFISLQTMAQAGIAPTSGMLFLAPLANAVGRLKIAHGTGWRMALSPVAVMFYATAYERQALHTTVQKFIRANAIKRDSKKLPEIQVLLSLVEQATQNLGQLYDKVEQGGELVRFRLPRHPPHNLGPRDSYPVELAA